MTRYDLLRMNASVIKVFLTNKIRLQDADNLVVFEEYVNMRNRGEKYSYVVGVLAQKYGMTTRSVSNIVQRMKGDVKVTI